MRRIYDTALQRNYPIAPFCLLYLEAMLSMGDYKKAAKFVDDIMYEKPLWAKRYDDVLNCLRTVSYYASGNTNMAEIILQEVMKRNTVPVKALVATARRLDNLGATFLAYRLLESAVNKDPRHQLALTRLVQMDIKIGNSTNLDKNILKLLQMRRPPRELIEGAQKNLGSDRFIFAKDREKINSITNFLNVYFEENGAINMISQKLFIHKNTVQYKIQKVIKQTGYDPRKTEDGLKLLLACKLTKLYSDE